MRAPIVSIAARGCDALGTARAVTMRQRRRATAASLS
jgi:hypothetical protein